MRFYRITALLLALAVTGCTTMHTGIWSYGEEPLPATKVELFDQFGLPDAIRSVPGSPDHWLRYDYSRSKGMTLGARYQGLGLLLSRQRRAVDNVWVRVDPDGRVLEWDPGRSSPDLRYRLWPFGG
jgi:hypothetical protein